MAKQPPVKKAAPTKAAPQKKPAAAPAAPAAPEKFSLTDLTDAVCAKLPMASRGVVAKVVQTTFEEIATAYKAGKIVNIKDFGKIEIKHRPSRTGRNPATGDTITIPAKVVPKFTFAKALKDAAK